MFAQQSSSLWTFVFYLFLSCRCRAGCSCRERRSTCLPHERWSQHNPPRLQRSYLAGSPSSSQKPAGEKTCSGTPRTLFFFSFYYLFVSHCDSPGWSAENQCFAEQLSAQFPSKWRRYSGYKACLKFVMIPFYLITDQIGVVCPLEVLLHCAIIQSNPSVVMPQTCGTKKKNKTYFLLIKHCSIFEMTHFNNKSWPQFCNLLMSKQRQRRTYH